ncbi:AAA family ATPase [Oscillatoria sp. FACHB-1407]|uniref:WD40 domain-containing protein n=1 Tax=Oscillatoria sp. FACHB-1407 TaxID=2692847 RepID=UPI001686CF50|nr:AAA family ATPase [Oscillatoria sp. FACHB-1407]MBD2461381.1 AAA family ATPase [Oscillatoria sp. FACHB-1407]
MSSTLDIRLLGGFSLAYGDRPIPGITTSRSQALLACLVLHRHTPQPRQRLAFYLWADSTDTQARSNLRKELSYLRRDLPEADRFLIIESKTLQWSPAAPFTLDVMAFENAVKAAAQTTDPDQVRSLLEQAIQLYQGDLLPSCEDEWIVSERERLQQIRVKGLEQLIDLLKTQQDYRTAIGYAQQLLRIDSLNEAAYASLMQLHWLSGDRANALQLYHRCITVLREEMGVDPSATTRDLYQRILNEDEQPTPPELPRSTSIPPALPVPPTTQQDWGEAIDVSTFYGRVTELSTLHQWINRDRCRLVLLLGMGGIGKTALAVKLAQEIVGNREAKIETGNAEAGTQNSPTPHSLLPILFTHIIWRSLRNAPLLETLLDELIPFLSDQQDVKAEIGRFIHWLKRHRCLVILDNIESIFQEGDRAGHYRAGYESYGELFKQLGEVQHQSCVLLTSREKPAEIAVLEGTTAVQTLHLGGVPEAACAIIEAKGLIGSDTHKQQLCQFHNYNPLALKIVSTSIQDLFDGKIEDFLAQDTNVFHGLYQLLDQQCLRSSILERNLMFWLAINREWTTLSELSADLVPPTSRVDLLEALKSLSWRSLLEKQSGSYTQAPIVMEYVTDRLIEWICDEIEEMARTADPAIPIQPSLIDTSRLPKPQFPVPLLHSHALLKAQGKDYIQDIQIRQIVQPILNKLQLRLGDRPSVERVLTHLLTQLRQNPPPQLGYTGGNLLNLLIHLKTDLTGVDLSHLALWQADLRNVRLQQANLTHTDLSKTVFTEPLSLTLAVAFSPDGQLLATGDTNREVRVWRVADGKNVLTLQGHTNWIWSVAFSPDGQRLASGSDDKTIKLWDLQTGHCLQTLPEDPYPVWSVAFSPDGQTLASGSEAPLIKLWDLSTGTGYKTLEGHTNWVRSLTFSPDGQTLASGSDDETIKLWNLKTGKCSKTLRDHGDRVWSVAFSPDGQTLASGSSDQTVKLWNLHTGKCARTFVGHSNWVRSIAFSPDGQTLASGSEDQTVKLWQVETGACFQTLRGHTSWVRAVAFSPDGQTLASGSGDQTIKLWHFQTGQCRKTFYGYANRVRTVAFSPTAPLLASGYDDYTVKLWDSRTGQCLHTLRGHTNSVCGVAFNPTGHLLASSSGDQTVKLWHVSSQQCLRTLQGHRSRVWSVAFSADGQTLASSSDDQTIKLWDVDTGQCLQTLEGHTSWVCGVAFSADGQTLASGSYDQTIKLWDVRTGQCLQTLQGHSNWVWAIAISPDGQTLASGSGDHTVKLWDLTTGQCLQTLQGHSSRVWSVAFSPDGQTLASGSSDQTVRLWQVATGQGLHRLQKHTNLIWSVAFSPDGQTLASGSQDETIQLWTVQTGDALNTLKADRPYEGTRITDASGLTEAQEDALKALGAVTQDNQAQSLTVASSSPLPAASPPLIGRDRQWQLLYQWLTAPSDTHPSEILLLLGEAGIGKTRLLEELAATVRTNQGQVLWGWGFETEMLRPYGAWVDALRSLPLESLADLPPLRSLFPEVSVKSDQSPRPEESSDYPLGETASHRSWLLDAVVHLLSRLSTQHPTTLVILDNAQWLDEASIALLHYAARLFNQTTVRFACAARPRELTQNQSLGKLIQALRRDNRLRTVELPLLEQADIVQLVHAVNGAIDGNQVFADSGGNPLFALEITRAASQPGHVSLDSLEALIQDRLRQISPSTREFLTWAAVLGRSFNPSLIAAIAHCPLTDLLVAIEELEQEGIIRQGAILTGETQYAFVHDVVRQVAYQQISTPRRRLMHLQIAQALKKSLATDDSLAGDIAYHASLGDDHELAASTYMIAAERCLRLFAYAEASQLTQQGLHHCQFLDECTRVRCQIELLKLHVLAGVTKDRAAKVETQLRRLIDEAQTLGLKDEEATGFEVLIALNYDHGNLTSVQQHSLEAIERGRAASSTTTARMLAYTGWCLAETEREMPRAEALLLEAQSLAARAGLELIDIPCGLGCVRRHAADFAAARQLLHRAWRMAQAEQDHWRECVCLTYLAMTELEAGNPIAALSYSTELATVTNNISGEASEGAFAAALDALARYSVGEDSANVLLEQALAQLRQLDSQRMLAYTLTIAAGVDLQHDRVEMAIAHAEEAFRAAKIVAHPSELALAGVALAQARLTQGDRSSALQLLEDLQQQLDLQTVSTLAQKAIAQLWTMLG